MADLSTAQKILKRIQDLVRELLQDIARGSLPVISIDRFIPCDSLTDGDGLSVYERCESQERIALKGRTSTQRIVAFMRVLLIVQGLLQQEKHASKRDVYYMDPRLFGDQVIVDQAINDICTKLKCARSSIHVFSASKGLVMGCLQYIDQGRLVDCSRHRLSGFPIPTLTDGVTPMSEAEYILLVEKETVFQRLANDGYCMKNRCIVITGRGYPDVPTRSFLRLLVNALHLPVYGLVDADPYGLDILCTYRFGSLAMAYDAEALATPSIRWLGVFLSDVRFHGIPVRCLLPLRENDKRKAEAMLKRQYLKIHAPLWWLLCHSQPRRKLVPRVPSTRRNTEPSGNSSAPLPNIMPAIQKVHSERKKSYGE
ncbi:hypothetical protein O6H91_04G135800 [Diphasiastrum complanatum]|uniref:Uncharacterized protein n=2 Tax=Diphasiastrum complanatum TaxID=34168 RepID=A0ACC2E1R8_DIPCM|nr:hypothetical protein O6H91_04G135300 [Diphasiastrum complanatum]KAJ7560574.1 hypothetical protein O6H91_04G135800 [Diphasiastrum complanatum]